MFEIPRKDEYKIIVSGDSISRGVIYDEVKKKYVIVQENYVSLLQNKLKGIVSNTARFGNTILKGFDKMKKDTLQDKPDIVLIEYGGNDCDFNWNEIAEEPDREHNPKTDFRDFETKLKEMILFLRNQKVIPVLTSLPPLHAERYFKWVSQNNPIAESNILKWLGSVTKIYWWQERYNSMIIKVAQETETAWIDIRGAFLQFPDFSHLLCMDGIHPNEEGHQIIADKVLDFIRSGYDVLLKDKTDLSLSY
ncbi:SGNH/GDSL hydrolase family protein [Gorillibacterium massiliense]|uniref:SGNH/GDSL hydrolase family protein n=1 Tax=Gorillibacterium massiliense TaxID=1280390 RepID=UPI0004AE35C4|nr:SGNH/GDSL hydrolase family protein [Gorillibacterium massiliense]